MLMLFLRFILFNFSNLGCLIAQIVNTRYFQVMSGYFFKRLVELLRFEIWHSESICQTLLVGRPSAEIQMTHTTQLTGYAASELRCISTTAKQLFPCLVTASIAGPGHQRMCLPDSSCLKYQYSSEDLLRQISLLFFVCSIHPTPAWKGHRFVRLWRIQIFLILRRTLI